MSRKNGKINIILVDPHDRKIGVVEKIIGHHFGMLHRALSVCIFRKRNNKLQSLIQQRSKIKYHGGGLWSNTCCSHAKLGKRIAVTALECLQNEMGISTKLKEVGKFHYVAKLDHGMTENEIDHVFVGTYEEDIIPFNKNEVDNYKWVDVNKLLKDLSARPKKYTPWFKQALELSLKKYG